MGETGENLKFVKRGATHVLVEDSAEEEESRPKVQSVRKQDENKASIFLRHPRLFAFMTVLGAGVSGLLISNEKFFKAEGSGRDLRTVAEVENISEQNLLEFPKPFEEAYGNLLPGEKEEALQFVIENGAKMENMSNEQIARVLQYKGIVEKSVENTPIPSDLLLGLIAVESKGDRFAVSSTGVHLGLTQMSEGIARKHGLAVTGDENDERFIPEKIIPATAAELSEYMEVYGDDISLTLDTWHAGMGNVSGLIQTYVENSFGYRLPDFGNGTDPEIVKLYTDEVAGTRTNETETPTSGDQIDVRRGTRINSFRLLQDPETAEIIKGESWDNHDLYSPSVITSALVLSESSGAGKVFQP